MEAVGGTIKGGRSPRGHDVRLVVVKEDRIAHGFSQLELLRVQEVLRRHLPGPPARVLDVGGATGVHARWLAEDGYRVRIIDITPRHVDTANAELSGLGVVAEAGDARRLNGTDNSFDVVLMFGPLYHLPEHDDRIMSRAEFSGDSGYWFPTTKAAVCW
jgi:2-polyprenyl-3-methyl-5-hydroxy-6-metoxy-1,4-benzoquinol methylase